MAGDLLAERVRQVAGLDVGEAQFGGKGEAGRDGEAEVGHLGEAGALPPQDVAHRRRAVRAARPEGVDEALDGRQRSTA